MSGVVKPVLAPSGPTTRLSIAPPKRPLLKFDGPTPMTKWNIDWYVEIDGIEPNGIHIDFQGTGSGSIAVYLKYEVRHIRLKNLLIEGKVDFSNYPNPRWGLHQISNLAVSMPDYSGDGVETGWTDYEDILIETTQ